MQRSDFTKTKHAVTLPKVGQPNKELVVKRNLHKIYSLSFKVFRKNVWMPSFQKGNSRTVSSSNEAGVTVMSGLSCVVGSRHDKSLYTQEVRTQRIVDSRLTATTYSTLKS